MVSCRHIYRCLVLAGEQNKSAVTDHAISLDYVIDWDQAKVIDRESNRMDRWIKEAIVRYISGRNKTSR